MLEINNLSGKGGGIVVNSVTTSVHADSTSEYKGKYEMYLNPPAPCFCVLSFNKRENIGYGYGEGRYIMYCEKPNSTNGEYRPLQALDTPGQTHTICLARNAGQPHYWYFTDEDGNAADHKIYYRYYYIPINVPAYKR